MATPHHSLSLYVDGVWFLDHPVTCEPAECPYVSSVTDEVVEKSTKVPKSGFVNVYKVTGTDSPKFDLEGDSEPDEPSDATSTAEPYDLIEDRDAYDAALKENTPPEWLDDEVKIERMPPS